MMADDILRELADLWVTTGRGAASDGVLRACIMTLIVVSDEANDAQALGETIGALMPEYPARTILVRIDRSENPAPTAHVRAQCWTPFGQRRQICSEQVEITASERSSSDLPPLVSALIAPELPVTLWCRSARFFESADFERLTANTDRIIADSSNLPDALAILRLLASRVAERPCYTDLSWTRLTRWREMIARFFENAEYQARLPQVNRLQIFVSGDPVPVSAWYMAGWLASSLEGAGFKAEIAMTPDSRLERNDMRVVMTAGDFEATLRREADHIIMEAAGFSHCTGLPDYSDYALMREELGIGGRDQVFERALSAATRLSGAGP